MQIQQILWPSILATCFSFSVSAATQSYPTLQEINAFEEAFKGVAIGTAYDGRNGKLLIGTEPFSLAKLNAGNQLSGGDGGTGVYVIGGSAASAMTFDQTSWSLGNSISAGTPFVAASIKFNTANTHAETIYGNRVDLNAAAIATPNDLLITRTGDGKYFAQNPTEFLKYTSNAQFIEDVLAITTAFNLPADDPEAGTKKAQAIRNFTTHWGTHVVTGVKLISYSNVHADITFDSDAIDTLKSYGGAFSVGGGTPSVGGKASASFDFLQAAKDHTTDGNFSATSISKPIDAQSASWAQTLATKWADLGLTKITQDAITNGVKDIPSTQAPSLPSLVPTQLTPDQESILRNYIPRTWNDAVNQAKYIDWLNKNPGKTREDYERSQVAPDLSNSEVSEGIAFDDSMDPLPSNSPQSYSARSMGMNSGLSAADAGSTNQSFPGYIVTGIQLTPWDDILGINFSEMHSWNKDYALMQTYINSRFAVSQYFDFLTPFYDKITRFVSDESTWNNNVTALKNIVSNFTNKIDKDLNNGAIIDQDYFNRHRTIDNAVMQSPALTEEFKNLYKYVVENINVVLDAPFGYGLKLKNEKTYIKQTDPMAKMSSASRPELLNNVLRFYPIPFTNVYGHPKFMLWSFLNAEESQKSPNWNNVNTKLLDEAPFFVVTGPLSINGTIPTPIEDLTNSGAGSLRIGSRLDIWKKYRIPSAMLLSPRPDQTSDGTRKDQLIFGYMNFINKDTRQHNYKNLWLPLYIGYDIKKDAEGNLLPVEDYSASPSESSIQNKTVIFNESNFEYISFGKDEKYNHLLDSKEYVLDPFSYKDIKDLGSDFKLKSGRPMFTIPNYDGSVETYRSYQKWNNNKK